LAEEYPEDADWLQPAPHDFTDEPWHALYFRAFEALRFDRFYGSLGGETPVTYLAKSRYADDLGLTGETLETFHHFFNAIDAEYLDWCSARDKANQHG